MTVQMESVENIILMSREYSWYSGIYFLLNDDEIVYVGISEDVYTRIAKHRKEGKKKFNRVTVFQVEDEKLRSDLEVEYIVHLAPKYNKNIPRSDKWTTINVLFRDLYYPDNKQTVALSTYIERSGIQDVNGYYLVSDFYELFQRNS